MSKQSSILNFFGKSPKPSPSSSSASRGSSAADTEQSRAAENTSSFFKRPQSESTPTSTPKRQKPLGSSQKTNTAQPKTPSQQSQSIDNFKELDLIWARLDTYEYWPALVCKHPKTNEIRKKERRNTLLNVQWLDTPLQRSWVKLINCQPLTDAQKHPKRDIDITENLKNAMCWAKEVLALSYEKRKELLVELPASEDEEMDEDDDEIANESFKDPVNEDGDEPVVRNNVKRKRLDLSSSSEDENPLNISQGRRAIKRRPVVDISDLSGDSGDEYKPSKNDLSDDSESDLEEVESDAPSTVSEPDISEDEEYVKPKSRKSAGGKFKGKAGNRSMNKSLNCSMNASMNVSQLGGGFGFDDEDAGSTNAKEHHIHLTFDFLKPEKIRDKKNRRPDDPDYDPTTLFVPDSFLKQQTPGLRQWWKIKSDHYDKLLLFKVGKFYELYHMDAVIACNLLNLTQMRGNYAHSGFPEHAYRNFAERLLNAGHKLVRIEQTETPEARDERNKSAKSKDKVVSREVCRVTSAGTRNFNVMDSNLTTSQSIFLLALTEKYITNDISEFGVCLIDTSIGRFFCGQFTDDRCLSSLRTIFSQFPPAEVLLNKQTITRRTNQVIKNCLPNAIVNSFSTDRFWTSRQTLRYLMENRFYEDDDKQTVLPLELKSMLDASDSLNLTAKKEYDAAICAFGAVICYLKQCLIDEEIITLRLFSEYKGSETLTQLTSAIANEPIKYMLLDSISLKNLEIFENSLGSTEGTLMDSLDTCLTNFGKRRLRSWICAPLCTESAINQRLDAVENLLKLDLNEVKSLLKGLHDLERLLAQIHSQASYRRSKEHPDSRAVMFDNTLNKRKILVFISLLDDFKRCDEIVQELRGFGDEITSCLLKKAITLQSEGGMYPDLKAQFKYFDHAFDHELAKKDGKIVPKAGVNEPYEIAQEGIKQIEKQLDQLRKEVMREFNTTIKYTHAGKAPYQLEFPDSLVKRLDKKYELQSSRKGFKRFYTPEIKHLVAKLKQLEEDRKAALSDCMRLIFEKFDRHHAQWARAINCISLIDCLTCFASYSRSLRKMTDVCRPTFVSNAERTVIRMKDAKHPTILKSCDNFISNDIQLDDRLMLITGPNMGGKSTLMRQTAIICILAQMGCFVPASECCQSLIDRIFTRLGASDRILERESTFYVELSETAIILKHATRNSLILLDELGRGTSTFDGTAIAYSVARYLSSNICSPTIFSTHYHSLVEDFQQDKRILFKHMACKVENENSDDPTEESITFLYKLSSGYAPKSYGFHAATLAQIPKHVVKCGFSMAKSSEKQISGHQIYYKLMNKRLELQDLRYYLRTNFASN